MAMELIINLDPYMMHNNAHELLMHLYFIVMILITMLHVSQNNYILVTFDLSIVIEVAIKTSWHEWRYLNIITIDRIIMYHIWNKIIRCYLNVKKTACQYFNLYRNGKTSKTNKLSKIYLNILFWSPFFNFHFKQKAIKLRTMCGI